MRFVSNLGKVLVDHLDGDGALSDGRGHPLHRAMPDVAGGEHPGDARLERQRPSRSSGKLPSGRSRPVRTNPPSSRSTSSGNQSVNGWAPMSRKSASACLGRLGTGRDVGQHQLLEPAVAAAVDHLRAEPHVDVRGGLDLAHQVLGHARADRLPANDERHLPGIVGQVERGLPGRVGTADDECVTADEKRRLRVGAAVEHTGTDQGLERGNAEPAVARSHREQHGWGADGAAVGARRAAGRRRPVRGS